MTRMITTLDTMLRWDYCTLGWNIVIYEGYTIECNTLVPQQNPGRNTPPTIHFQYWISRFIRKLCWPTR